MADPAFDLEAWLDRIGYGGPREPTLATLGAIVLAHCTTIPFENIDVLLGQPPKLDMESLQRKLLLEGRGGYCYEQNLLLREGLRALGFAATGMIGRVLRGLPADAPQIATHMAVRVDLAEGPFLADVGFGNLMPTGPLALRPDITQATPHQPMRFLQIGDELVLQVRLADTWDNLYRLCSHVALDMEYEVANWFVGTHPGSMFVNNMVAARPGRDGLRHTFLNGRLSTRHLDGRVERRMLENDAEIAAVLADTFGLILPAEVTGAALAMLDQKGTRAAEHRFFV